MNENNPNVALTNEQGETLALTLDIFAEALRECRELTVADFQDIIEEVRFFQQSPCVCGKPSGVPAGDLVFRPQHALEFGD